MAAKLSIVFFVAMFSCISGAAIDHHKDRIVGGRPLNIKEAPWQVSLQINGTRHICGGSIISDRWIMTAAHCLGSSASSLKVRVGATHKYNEGQLIPVQKSIRHEKYNRGTTDYDYGLLELAESLQFTDAIKSIQLPNVKDDPTAAGTICLVSGWGNTQISGESREKLRGAEVPIVAQDKCAEAYNNLGRSITDRMICAGLEKGGKDSCQGDSGGPLVSFDNQSKIPTLVGIVSWGYGCAKPKYPGVYARVVAEREWIKSNTGV